MSTNNQPAFPTTINREIVRGMTLRDYFAAAVLPAVYEELNNAEGIFKRSDIAEHAYLMADAMLHFRDQA
jgi:hypothetical protein